MRMLRMLSNRFALRVEFPLVIFLLIRLRMALDMVNSDFGIQS